MHCVFYKTKVKVLFYGWGDQGSEKFSASVKDTQLAKLSLTSNPIRVTTEIYPEWITGPFWGMCCQGYWKMEPVQPPLWKAGIFGNRNVLELTVFPVMVSACLGFHTSVYSLSPWCLLTYLFFFTGKRSQWIFNQIELEYVTSESERLPSLWVEVVEGREIHAHLPGRRLALQGVRPWGLRRVWLERAD